jgi:hypothetical protein
MYSHTRLYRFCMLSGADQKNSGVSSTCDGGHNVIDGGLRHLYRHSAARTAKHPLHTNHWLTRDKCDVRLRQLPQSGGSFDDMRTVDSRLTPAFWMNTLPMSWAISLRSRVTRPAFPVPAQSTSPCVYSIVYGTLDSCRLTWCPSG